MISTFSITTCIQISCVYRECALDQNIPRKHIVHLEIINLLCKVVILNLLPGSGSTFRTSFPQ